MRWTNSLATKLTVWVMALLPVTFAVLNHTRLHSIPLSIPAPKRPALAFHQYAVDLRTIQPTTPVQAHFAFQNRGQQPVRITKVEPSCQCLTTQIQGARDNTIDSGGQGRIVVRLQPANSTPGPHTYTVNVSYNDPEPNEVQLTLKLVIPETLWVTPRLMSFYHRKGASPTTADFTVSDGRAKRFEITDVSVSTELVEAAVGETSVSPTGNYQQTVRIVVAGDLPPGQSQHMLTIRTTDREFAELKVPIFLRGPTESPGGEAEHAHDHEAITPVPKHAAAPQE